MHCQEKKDFKSILEILRKFNCDLAVYVEFIIYHLDRNKTFDIEEDVYSEAIVNLEMLIHKVSDIEDEMNDHIMSCADDTQEYIDTTNVLEFINNLNVAADGFMDIVKSCRGTYGYQ